MSARDKVGEGIVLKNAESSRLFGVVLLNEAIEEEVFACDGDDGRSTSTTSMRAFG